MTRLAIAKPIDKLHCMLLCILLLNALACGSADKNRVQTETETPRLLLERVAAEARTLPVTERLERLAPQARVGPPPSKRSRDVTFSNFST